MFTGDETAGCHKRDNFPKDREILPLVSDGGLSVDESQAQGVLSKTLYDLLISR